jgi:S1-C subfamily serine protease
MSEEPIYGNVVPGPAERARSEFAPHPRVTTPLAEAPALPAPPRPRQGAVGRLGWLLLSAGLVLGLLIGGVSGGMTALLLRAPANTPAAAVAPPPVAVNPGNPVTAQTSTIGQVYRQVAGAVVQVGVTLNGGGRFGGGEGEGTGIIVDNEGHILTNNHVVNNAKTVRVRLLDGTTLDATVVGTAPQDDLAVIQASIPADKLVVAQLGTSANVQVGDTVIAIGNPFGLDHTVTAGIISAVNRDWTPTNGRTMNGMIQTDAPINPGNSGGPLLNEQGQVIGINTAIESPVEGSVGIGFSIPIDRAKELLPQLQTGAQLTRPWLGIRGGEITPSLAASLSLPVEKGVLVTEVVADSPASKAGLQGVDPTTDNSGAFGDIITEIDGQAVSSVTDLTGYLNSKKVGDQVTLTVLRDGKTIQVPVTLEAWRDTPDPSTQPQPNQPSDPTQPNFPFQP